MSNKPQLLPLNAGGTNASLTASNGGIFYSTSSAAGILSGTSTANQLLLSGSSTTPSWSTSTYPSTNAVNTLLYASSANTMAALPTANNSYLTTSGTGVPTWATETVTQYNILIGGASSAIASVAPSSTSGVPLISQGSSSNPTFGTALVAGGGTGLTTTTAYGLIAGGTTATGAFQNVGTGTSGYVLLAQGSSALPTWNAYSGNLILLSSQTASSSSTINFTSVISSTYTTYFLRVIYAVPATNAVTLGMRFGTGAGPSWDSSADYEQAGYQVSANASINGAYSGTAQDQFNITQSLSSTASNGGACCEVYLYNLNSGSTQKLVLVDTVQYYTGQSDTLWCHMGCRYTSSTAITGIQLLMSSGNIASGTFNLYGVSP